MDIKRLFEIFKCKRHKFSVTLRRSYRGQTQDEALADFRLRIKLNKQNFLLKYFLSLMTLALVQIYTDVQQWLTFIDKTPHSPSEALLWSNIEPEAVQYISFL